MSSTACLLSRCMQGRRNRSGRPGNRSGRPGNCRTNVWAYTLESDPKSIYSIQKKLSSAQRTCCYKWFWHALRALPKSIDHPRCVGGVAKNFARASRVVSTFVWPTKNCFLRPCVYIRTYTLPNLHIQIRYENGMKILKLQTFTLSHSLISRAAKPS